MGASLAEGQHCGFHLLPPQPLAHGLVVLAVGLDFLGLGPENCHHPGTSSPRLTHSLELP